MLNISLSYSSKPNSPPDIKRSYFLLTVILLSANWSKTQIELKPVKLKLAIDSNISFSEEGQSELDVMYNRVVSAYTYALESMRTDNVDLACKVIKIEEQVDTENEDTSTT